MYTGLYEKLSSYSLIIFDMDGTMYFKRSMQIRMGARLVMHALFHRGGMKDMRAVLDYRRMRENWDSSKAVSDDEFFSRLSDRYGIGKERAASLISEWLFEIPLEAVRKSADSDLAETVKQLLRDGKKVCIYSDYPAKDKCAALDLPEDIGIFSCGDPGIGKMKPDPEGILHILGSYPGLSKKDIVMVGDRMDRDGLAAEAAGVGYVILDSFRISRRIRL